MSSFSSSQSCISSEDELNVVVQNIHRSLYRDALDSCDFYQLSPELSLKNRLELETRTRVAQSEFNLNSHGFDRPGQRP